MARSRVVAGTVGGSGGDVPPAGRETLAEAAEDLSAHHVVGREKVIEDQEARGALRFRDGVRPEVLACQ